MSWLYGISTLDIVLIVVFAALYGLYFFRLFSISRKLKTRFGGFTFKFFLRTLYFLLLIVVLMGPSFGESKREVQSVGKDIFLLVDLSQ